ncbi:Two-component response regulator-like [Dionaea muscipula]
MNQSTAAPRKDVIQANDQTDGTVTSTGMNLFSQLHCVDGKATQSRLQNMQSASTCTLPKISETDECKESPVTEQSLKRIRGLQEVQKPAHDDRNVVRRSQCSAFSRYNPFRHNRTSDHRSPSPLANGIDGRKSEQICNIQSHSGSNGPSQCSNGGSFYIDITSTSNDGFIKDLNLRNMSAKNNLPSHSQKATLDDAADGELVKWSSTQPRSTEDQECKPRLHQQLPVCCDIQLWPLPGHPHSVSSNIGGGGELVDGIAAGNSLNGYGIASGSDHGSNGQNGCSTAANVGGLYNNENDKSGSKSGSGNQVDQSRLAQREAAFTKFQPKRKVRCFKGKEVRYQRSGKTVAEQQPHVRGQFVRRGTGS